MSTASRMSIDDCARFSAWVAPYVDGELDPGHAVEMEAHVVGCSTCAERVALIRAIRASLKRTTAHRAPPELCARIGATIANERRRSVEPTDATWSEQKLTRLHHAVGFAAAASLVLAFGMSRLHKHAPIVETSESDTASTTMNMDGVLEELIALHARPFPPDTTDPDQLARFDPLLGVQVRRPAFQPLGVSFKGARVHPVADRGALLQVQYTTPDGRRVTMYVFNPRVLPVHATRLEPRIVFHRPILVGRLRGYSLAALEQSGVGYAFASDLDTDESTKMVLAAIPQ